MYSDTWGGSVLCGAKVLQFLGRLMKLEDLSVFNLWYAPLIN